MFKVVSEIWVLNTWKYTQQSHKTKTEIEKKIWVGLSSTPSLDSVIWRPGGPHKSQEHHEIGKLAEVTNKHDTNKIRRDTRLQVWTLEAK